MLLDLHPRFQQHVLVAAIFALPEGWAATANCAEATFRSRFPGIDLFDHSHPGPDRRPHPQLKAKLRIGRTLLAPHLPIDSRVQVGRQIRLGARERDGYRCALGETQSRETQWLGDHVSHILVSAKTGRQIVL